MPPADSSPDDALLAEVVCALEEAEARPRETPDADAAARAAGGDFARRIRVRAAAMEDAEALRVRIERARGTIRGAALVLWFLSAVAGSLAALSVGAARTVNVPLALLLLVGLNLAMLLLWLVSQFAHRHVAHATAGWFRRLSNLIGRMRASADTRDAAVLDVLASGAHGRWLLGAVLHAGWLMYTLAALLVLALLLGFTSYEVSWQTTLFDAERLESIARAVNVVPSLLGLSAPELSALSGDAAASRAWGWWLLCAVVAYGVVPRLIGFASCAALLWRAQRRFGTDLSRPGYARLRQRLMPDVAEIGVVDPELPDRAQRALVSRGAAPLAGTVHGVWLEAVEGEPPPVLPGVAWNWLGAIDTADSRRALLERLRGERAIAAFAVVVRAAATPDRGVERAVAEIVAAVAAPVHLVLANFEQLEVRGADATAGRIADWRELVARAGAIGEPVPARGGAGP